MRVLLPLPVVLPLLGAALSMLFARRPTVQRLLSVSVLAGLLAGAVALLVAVDRDGTQVVQLGAWAAPAGISLVADRLSALLLVVSAAVLLAVLVYAVGQGVADGRRTGPLAVFHPCYLVLAAGIAMAFLTGDLFNLFVAFEVMLIASYVLLTLGGSRPAVRAGMTYVVTSLLASVLLVTVIGLVYAATGTVNMADAAVRLQDVPDGVRTALALTMLVVFGIKAAIFPLFMWLPDSYPTAPAPVTAVFAGLLTKVGVYAVIRTQTLLFPGIEVVADVLLVIGALTMVVGILGAVVQDDVKRVLSFTIVSHIGYMLLGLGLFSSAGLAGAVLYTVHHIVVQTTLFLVAGLMERREGTSSMARSGGLQHVAPLLAVLYLVPALSLAGIPPLSGFVAKVGLFQAGLADGGVLAVSAVVAGTLTSLLTLYAVGRVWTQVFWGPVAAVVADADTEDAVDVGVARTPRLMTGAAVAAVAGMLAITVVAGPLYGLAARAADDVVDPSVYTTAVLGEEVAP
ncbi:MAG TPA: Na+/H+ antiporter subunit D [Mycobacteriales bacterium]|nr:Na+/H+ antiporter subunit D [Mycobacteriales bacterium]